MTVSDVMGKAASVAAVTAVPELPQLFLAWGAVTALSVSEHGTVSAGRAASSVFMGMRSSPEMVQSYVEPVSLSLPTLPLQE